MSFNEGLESSSSKNDKWAVLTYTCGALSITGSATLLFLLHYLTQFDLVRKFLFIVQGITQILLLSLLLLTVFKGRKTWILGCAILTCIISGGSILTLGLIQYANYLQAYSGSMNLQPTHSGTWYEILGCELYLSFGTGAISIMVCIFAIQRRKNIPDLITDTVFKGSQLDQEFETVETHDLGTNNQYVLFNDSRRNFQEIEESHTKSYKHFKVDPQLSASANEGVHENLI